jgi:uncharacterized protein (DUF362 family)
MADRTTRREVLHRVAAGGAVLGAAAVLARLGYDRGAFGPSVATSSVQVRDFQVPADSQSLQFVVANSSQDPAELTRRAITAMGGMGRFISRGDIVAIKPNIGWDRMPIHAANTKPQVVAELVRLCFNAGARRVVVTDASCNEANRSFQRSGIWRAAHAAEATVILPAAHRFREMRMQGEVLDRWPVYTPLIDVDKVINVPVAKHHNLVRYTGAMKNWYGILGGRRNRLHQNIDVSIADLATFMRPTLTVLDATRVLMRNGPQGGNIDDARDMHQVIASTDQVAVDAYACTLIGERPERILYLGLGQERGLGQIDWRGLRHAEV